MRKTLKPLRIAVAGLGRIGWGRHALALAKHPDFQLVAVSDTEPTRREEAERELKCRAYADYERMLAVAELDAVVIATPTHLHKGMTLAALRRGLHVLLEKPMALNSADAETMVRAARKARRVLTIYQPARLGALHQTLLRLIASGKIGRVVRAQNALFSYARRNDWQALRKFGGGMLNNYGAHAIDEILPLIGYDVKRVFCQLQRVATLGDADDAAKIVLQTRKGVIGDVDISQASAISPYRQIVWGTCGAVWVQGGALHVRSFDPKKLPARALNPSLASAERKYPSETIPFADEVVAVDEKLEIDVYANLARAIRTGVAPYIKPEQTLAVMRIIDQCRKGSVGIAEMRKGAAR